MSVLEPISTTANAPQGPAVSARILHTLRVVAERQRILRIARALLRVAVAALAAWLALGLLLGHYPLPMPVRIAASAVAWGVLVGSAIMLLRPAFGRVDERAAAARIEQTFPDVEERISSAVELSKEENPHFRGSPELVAQLMRQAEDHAQAVDPHVVVSAKSVLQWCLAGVLMLVLWGIVLAWNPAAMGKGLSHLLTPWDGAADAAAVPVLTVQPGDALVAQGDTVAIDVELTLPEGVAPPAEGALTLVSTFQTGQSRRDVMSRVGPLQYRSGFVNVQTPFTYFVALGEAHSPTYTVSVLQRPAAAKLSVAYDYPAYTGLADRQEVTRDGTLEAVVGTQATLTVHSTMPLTSASRVVIGEKGQTQRTVALAPIAGTKADYTAVIPITQSTSYRLELVSDLSGRTLTNADAETPRRIIARPDAPPTVQITAPPAVLKIRPDDTAPVTFTAADDFGIAKVEALIAVDDRTPAVVAVPFQVPQGARGGAAGTWPLNVAEVLKRANVGDARRITYQLKVTDNAEPDAHTGLSTRHVLEIDRAATSVEQQAEKQAAGTLQEAITDARQKLEDAAERIEALRDPAAAPDREAAGEIKQDLARAMRELDQAAKAAEQSPFQDAARQARDTAGGAMRDATENMGKAQLSQGADHKRNLDAAAERVAEARKKLSDLEQGVREQVENRDLARQLEDIADRQRDLAQRMANAKTPEERQKIADAQKALQREMEELIREHPELAEAAEKGLEPKVEELGEKLDKLAGQQDKLADQLQTKRDAAGAPGRLEQIAKDQQKLNEEITRFSQAQRDALTATGGKAPGQKELDPIVKDLQENRTQTAAQGQRAAQRSLENAADRLAAAVERHNANGQRHAAAAKEARENLEQATRLEQSTQELSKAISEARDAGRPPTRPGDAANGQARQIAGEIQRAANEVARNAPGQKAAAEEARKAAAEAVKSANGGKAEEAQQKLSQAAQKLAQAAQGAAKDNNAAAGGKSPHEEAARAARDLADRQQRLAQETAGVIDAVEKAGEIDDAATAQAAEKLAQDIQQTAQQAQDAGKTGQGTAPETAKKLQDAAEAMQQAAKQQREAAGAARQRQPGKAQDAQQAASDALDQAKEKLTGQRPQRQARGTQQEGQGGQEQRPGANGQQTADAQPQGGKPSPTGQQPGGQPKGTEGQPVAGGAPEGQQTHQQRPGGQPTQQPNQQPTAQATDGQGPAKGSGENGQQPTAEAIRKAYDAMRQAGDKSDPNAAGRAADALAQAAEKLKDAPAGQRPGGTPQPGGGQPLAGGGPPVPGSGQPGGQPTASANTSGGNAGTGARITPTASKDTRPDEVKAVGIAPSDWARLPPAMQEQLLHSARQKGPPEYQSQIKHYYQRIARMSAQEPPPKEVRQ